MSGIFSKLGGFLTGVRVWTINILALIILIYLVAAVVMLVGASSAITYLLVKENVQPTVIASPDMIFEQASFGNRYYLGPGFQDARSRLQSQLDDELAKLAPEPRSEVRGARRRRHTRARWGAGRSQPRPRPSRCSRRRGSPRPSPDRR